MKETITNQLEDFFNSKPENFQIVEEQIDIDLQFEYFNLSKKEKNNIVKEDVFQQSAKLFENETTEEDKKVLLVKLAAIEDVEALRTIERFYKDAGGELADWAYLAKKESKLIIESALLDKKQVLISTGLGGRGSLLRYFIVLITKEGQEYSDTQKKIIKNEFDYILKLNQSELETIEFESKYSLITTLIPLNVSIKNTLKSAVQECNSFGDFLEENFLVTNVKILSLEEIEQFLNDTAKDNNFAPDPEEE